MKKTLVLLVDIKYCVPQYWMCFPWELVSLSWKYVQKTRETERLWRHWYRNECKLGPKFWRMDGPVISNWKRLIIFLGDFSVWPSGWSGLLCAPPFLYKWSFAKRMVLRMTKNIFLVGLGWNSHQTCPQYRGSSIQKRTNGSGVRAKW